MKTGKMFWGFFCLSLGTLFLLDRLDIIYSSFDFVWKLWPLIFVFWGLAIMLRHSKARPVVSAFNGMFIALFLYGAVSNASYFYEVDFDEEGYVFRDKVYSEPFQDNIEYASFQLNGGAGEFSIKTGREMLFEAEAEGTAELYSYENYMNGNFSEVKLSVDKGNVSLFDSETHNRLYAMLHYKPVWNIYLNMGACENHVNLTGNKVKYVQVNTGASDTYIKLGDLYDRTAVKVNMGAAACRIKIPESSGCKITGSMMLLTKGFDGFIEVDGDYYTKNYKTAEKLIKIEVNGALGEIIVDKY